MTEKPHTVEHKQLLKYHDLEESRGMKSTRISTKISESASGIFRP